MGQAILAIDQGTTSSRAIVFDSSGVALGSAQEAIQPFYPQPGWVNQDAAGIWTTTLDVAQRAITASGLTPAEIAGIGITNQRETTVLWNRSTGHPVAPAIVWQSRQSAPLVDAIAARGKSATYQRITGLVPDAYFSATKIAWLLENNPELRRRAEAGEILFGTIDCWLMWNLSGGLHHVTDYSNASRTMLFDIRSGDWSDALLSDLSIPREMLPGIVENATVLFESVASLFGAAIPVAGVAGDQQAALFGQTCFSPGQVKNTYGTGSFLVMNTGADAIDTTCNLLTTIGWNIGGARTFALEGSIFVTGSAVQWLRDGLGIIEQASDIEVLAATVPDSGGVVFVPALAGLGAPHWDQTARGTIIGITRGTTAAHIARATLEAIALQAKDVVDAMVVDSGVELRELRVDGGATRNNLLMQIQADVLGVPVVRPTVVETTALGAAYLAGLATGVWPGQDELRNIWREDRRFEPQGTRSDHDRLFLQWRAAVERSKNWAEV